METTGESDRVAVLAVLIAGAVAAALKTWVWFDQRRAEEYRHRGLLRALAEKMIYPFWGLFLVELIHALGRFTPRYGPQVSETISLLFGLHWFQLALLPGCAAISALLFSLKSRRVRVYAALEFGLGLFAGWLALAPFQTGHLVRPPEDPDRIMKVVAAIYLMIRAMDNWSKAPDRNAKGTVDGILRYLTGGRT